MYSETVVIRLAHAASEETGLPKDEVMESFGMAFVTYTAKHGYDR